MVKCFDVLQRQIYCLGRGRKIWTLLDINYKISTLINHTSINNIFNANSFLKSHEAEDREDDESGKHAGAAVDKTDDQRILVAVVVELVVARHSNEATRARTERVEDLGRGVGPHAGLEKLLEVRGDVEENSLAGPFQRDATEKQDGQHDVGENGREVHYLKYERRDLLW